MSKHKTRSEVAPPTQREPNLEALDSQGELARLAYQFWVDRGCPVGSPEVDWLRAEDELGRRARVRTATA